jgi:hypothetical protein
MFDGFVASPLPEARLACGAAPDGRRHMVGTLDPFETEKNVWCKLFIPDKLEPGSPCLFWRRVDLKSSMADLDLWSAYGGHIRC